MTADSLSTRQRLVSLSFFHPVTHERKLREMKYIPSRYKLNENGIRNNMDHILKLNAIVKKPLET